MPRAKAGYRSVNVLVSQKKLVILEHMLSRRRVGSRLPRSKAEWMANVIEARINKLIHDIERRARD